jgi:hypothetical protein
LWADNQKHGTKLQFRITDQQTRLHHHGRTSPLCSAPSLANTKERGSTKTDKEPSVEMMVKSSSQVRDSEHQLRFSSVFGKLCSFESQTRRNTNTVFPALSLLAQRNQEERRNCGRHGLGRPARTGETQTPRSLRCPSSFHESRRRPEAARSTEDVRKNSKTPLN